MNTDPTNIHCWRLLPPQVSWSLYSDAVRERDEARETIRDLQALVAEFENANTAEVEDE